MMIDFVCGVCVCVSAFVLEWTVPLNANQLVH
jgi:hypothetical protein